MMLINGQNIDLSSLPLKIDLDGSDEWNVAIRSAIQNWFDGFDYVMMHTSGSTGKPKPIRLLKSDIEASVKLTIETFGLTSSDTIACCLPLNYIAGRMMLYRGIIGGMNTMMIEPSINPIGKINDNVDFIALTPMQLECGLDESPDHFKYVDKVLVGGAPISEKLEERVLTSVSHVYASYGMTETLTHVAVRELGRSSSFKALSGVSFSTTSNDCLVIHASHLSQSTFETHDVVQLLDDKRFIWMGRKDRIINVGGIKISPEIIEKKLQPLMSHSFFIMGLVDDRAGQRPILVIEGMSWTHDHLEKLKADMEMVCEKYEQPSEIYFAQKFAKTHTGKIDQMTTLTAIQGLL